MPPEKPKLTEKGPLRTFVKWIEMGGPRSRAEEKDVAGKTPVTDSATCTVPFSRYEKLRPPAGQGMCSWAQSPRSTPSSWHNWSRRNWQPAPARQVRSQWNCAAVYFRSDGVCPPVAGRDRRVCCKTRRPIPTKQVGRSFVEQSRVMENVGLSIGSTFVG